MVTPNGFAWNGETFDSLSEIAPLLRPAGPAASHVRDLTTKNICTKATTLSTTGKTRGGVPFGSLVRGSPAKAVSSSVPQDPDPAEV
jgi:hypothetical protein